MNGLLNIKRPVWIVMVSEGILDPNNHASCRKGDRKHPQIGNIGYYWKMASSWR